MNLIPFSDFKPEEHGFRSGLEVHHQLLTTEKLFCHCPAGLYSDDYHAQVVRHMRPTLSELGEYDGTALMEFKTRKVITYRLHKQSVCTYEMDDNPPFLINKEAVDIAIEIALLLNCSIVGELHVIRKQYLDGSIPAGFQRTAIIGLNGWIPYKGRRINITQLALEEDACREVSDIGHHRIYNTDRLSMPLIEVVTAPDMVEPIEVMEVGQLIGRLLRSTGKVRRGLGSVREDVNVSINGGTRIEIKGVPRLPLIPRLVHCEAYRQHGLLALAEELTRRGVTAEHLESTRQDLTGEFQHEAISEDSDDQKVFAVVLKGLAGTLKALLGPDRTFADDIAGRLKVIACLPQRPVMLHTDNDTLSVNQKKRLQSITGHSDDDAVIIVWGSEEDAETAVKEILIRYQEAATVIPNETRQRLSTGETEFERILPGPDRMYPDTDSPPHEIKHDHVQKIRGQIPEQVWKSEERYEKLGLPLHLTQMLVISPYARLFDELVVADVDPMLAATVLIELGIHYGRLTGSGESITVDEYRELFCLFRDQRFAREGFRLLIEAAAKSGHRNWDDLLNEVGLIAVKKPEIAEFAEQIGKNIDDYNDLPAPAVHRLLMGQIMKRQRGAFPGSDFAKIISNILDETRRVLTK